VRSPLSLAKSPLHRESAQASASVCFKWWPDSARYSPHVARLPEPINPADLLLPDMLTAMLAAAAPPEGSERR
jgi:hypothetical protein